MFDEPRRDVIPLIILGVYLGAAVTIAFNTYQRDRTNAYRHFDDVEFRLARLEDPEAFAAAKDAEES